MLDIVRHLKLLTLTLLTLTLSEKENLSDITVYSKQLIWKWDAVIFLNVIFCKGY